MSDWRPTRRGDYIAIAAIFFLLAIWAEWFGWDRASFVFLIATMLTIISA